MSKFQLCKEFDSIGVLVSKTPSGIGVLGAMPLIALGVVGAMPLWGEAPHPGC